MNVCNYEERAVLEDLCLELGLLLPRSADPHVWGPEEEENVVASVGGWGDGLDCGGANGDGTGTGIGNFHNDEGMGHGMGHGDLNRGHDGIGAGIDADWSGT